MVRTIVIGITRMNLVNLQTNSITFTSKWVSLFVSLDSCNKVSEEEQVLNLVIKSTDPDYPLMELTISKKSESCGSIYMRDDNLQLFEVTSEIYLVVDLYGFIFYITIGFLYSVDRDIPTERPTFGLVLYPYIGLPKWLYQPPLNNKKYVDRRGAVDTRFTFPYKF